MATPDDEYRALGRFAYEFSRLVHHLRYQLARLTMAAACSPFSMGRQLDALLLHTGDMNADHLADVYFAVAERVGDYTPEEGKVARRLRTNVSEFIAMRNDFFHGEWMIGWSYTVGIEIPGTGERSVTSGIFNPTVSRTKAKRSTTKHSVEIVRAADLNALSNDLQVLRSAVIEWGRLVEGLAVPDESEGVTALDVPCVRPGDVYILVGNEVLRQGRLAPDVPAPNFA
jgi:hypothetical protein